MDLDTLYHRTVESWVDRVSSVAEDQWQEPTPCTEWNVRELTNHVVGEDRWTVPLIRGKTMADVGNDLDGDLLGNDPIARALQAASEATSVVAEALPKGGKVALSYGPEEMEEYVHQLAADHLIHSWDLAVAIGDEGRLDPALVTEIASWFADREEMYRSAGAIGQRAALTGDPQADLLAAFGRSVHWGVDHAT